MPQEHRSDSSFAPEADGVGQTRDGSGVSPDETPSKVYPVKTVLFGVHVAVERHAKLFLSALSDQANVIAT